MNATFPSRIIGSRLGAAAIIAAGLALGCSRGGGRREGEKHEPEVERRAVGSQAAEGTRVPPARLGEPAVAHAEAEQEAPIPREPTRTVPQPLPPLQEPGLDGLDAIMLDAALGAADVEPEQAGPPARKKGAKPRLVAYPFESGFDGGELGAKVAAVITGHAARTMRFETLPKITQDEMFRDRPFRATLDTEHRALARHARDTLDADIVVWGRVVTKPHSNDAGPYKARLRRSGLLAAAVGDAARKARTVGVRALDSGRERPVIEAKALDLRRRSTDSSRRRPEFSIEGRRDVPKGEPTLILAETYRCANIHLIPIYADEIVAALLGREAERRTVAVFDRALSGNLLANGSFEKGLAGWSANFPRFVSVEYGQLVGNVHRSIAGGHGLSVMSDYVPVEPGAHYELSLRVRSHRPSVITWVKGYAEFAPDSPGEWEVDARREVFRHQMRPAHQEEPGPDGWIEVATKPFRPRHPKERVGWVRVKLYAYHPPGKVVFDDVVLRKVAVTGEAPEGEDERMRRAYEGKDPGEVLKKDSTP